MAGLARSVPIELAVVHRAVAGDEAAFSRIVVAHHAEMARLAYVIVGDVGLAQDAVQSAWLIAWSRLGTIRDPSRLRSWLLSIAANEARQAARRARRRPVVEISADHPASVATDPGHEIGRIDLLNALSTIDTADRALIALRYLAGFDAAEIGAATGRSASATRTRLSRLMSRLRQELEHD